MSRHGLEDAAKGGQIFVSRNTYRLTRGAFAFQEMDPIKVKGKRDPLTVYELLYAKLQPDKSRGVEGLSSPLVGREAERQALVEFLEKLQTGRGQVAAILGEAGIARAACSPKSAGVKGRPDLALKAVLLPSAGPSVTGRFWTSCAVMPVSPTKTRKPKPPPA